MSSRPLRMYLSQAMNPPFEIVRAETPARLTLARALFERYAAWIGIDLEFQGFKEELAGLPGEYAHPGGCILLAERGREALGCVALRSLGADICEMKRLYVLPEWRGRGAGRALAEAVLREARERRYTLMRLDTLAHMREAIGLYRSLGFRKIEPYRFNPIEGAVYMELHL